ncbi:WD40 repeat-like protein [Cylindrobasidium torrendii FP15055 ss-10]|uniref:WD40 repeat-like protein n=1 Tax=Cylindrobasidium torrendii FP15055 ss-10 TaxID=1314674 RepID=A0A0D7BKY6_9AGAR|nr:WD40 repeat-like protein [Cylindrobasidium torrendii FP15055 ss-10]
MAPAAKKLKSAQTVSAKIKGKQRADPQPSSRFKLVAGSYEKLLYGLEGTIAEDSTFTLKPIFIFPAHVSCIKAVASSPHGGKWLATGSTDEIIKVWDLRRRKEVGGLMHHEGSITHLSFPSRSHLMSASQDGTLCLFRARDWAVLRSLKGHKGPVNGIAVHPSGKVAVSVGKDRTLRLWDLMRGRGVASTKLGKEGELVRWSTDGKLLAVQALSNIDIFNAEMTLLHSIKHPSRIHDIKFCKRVENDSQVLLVGAEDKKVSVYTFKDVEDPSNPPILVASFVGHGNRVKAIDTLVVAIPSSSTTTVISTVSSDGFIRLFDMSHLGKSEKDIQPVAEYDAKGTRFTCVTLADQDAETPLTAGKRKRDTKDSDDDEEDEDDEWKGVVPLDDGDGDGETEGSESD